MADPSLNISWETLLFAVLGGILPAVFWLWFWLKEDIEHPEPRKLIVLTFLCGGVAVVPAFFLQRFLSSRFGWTLEDSLAPMILSWAAIEETMKYLAARVSGLHSRYFDEPVDAMIYLLTAALGFAAIENSLYILNTFYTEGQEGLNFLLLGNFRFIGATVVHIVSSSILGLCLAFAFCSSKAMRWFSFGLGITTATLLHAAFNYFIITSEENALLQIFVVLWFAAIMIIFFFERVKNEVCQLKLKNKKLE